MPFFIKRPTPNEIDAVIAANTSVDFSYPFIGETEHGFRQTRKRPETKKYKVDHNFLMIGNGEGDFEKAKEAMRSWKMFDMPWVELFRPDTAIAQHAVVGVLVNHFGFWSLNLARIVYVIDTLTRFGFAYGTLPSHAESGEERFTVQFDRETGDVSYDLYAFSRPNNTAARLAYPLTRSLQKRFASDSKLAMLRAIKTIG